MPISNKVTLLVIDPQNDFCSPDGTLFVGGADEDMKRLATMVNDNMNMIDRINVTLDSHQYVHIAHPVWWVNSKGEHPDPLVTVITVDDVKNGVWRATNPQMQQYSLEYVEKLKAQDRYVLCIWPYHCLIGSNGAAIDSNLFEAFTNWEKNFRKINFVPKGSNIYTEHYSAVKADVEFSGDATTMLNRPFIEMLQKSQGDILIAGEALDFCIANTIRDIANEFSDDEVKRFVLLTDATSSVNAPGLEHLSQQFIDEMVAKGMRLSTTDTYFK